MSKWRGEAGLGGIFSLLPSPIHHPASITRLLSECKVRLQVKRFGLCGFEGGVASLTMGEVSALGASERRIL